MQRFYDEKNDIWVKDAAKIEEFWKNFFIFPISRDIIKSIFPQVAGICPGPVDKAAGRGKCIG